MRIHALEITAFGPFPETTNVDFDALSEAGLFLLSGPTGAGKSSILDAIAFALYGDVPGDRAGTRRLRCDTAPEGLAPRVVLEATLAGRRFRIDRSPAWIRPKRRGAGTTTQQARVAISELTDGSWLTRSTRLDETGHLVTTLIGMNLTQFCQVAMLPQGRFQAFLQATSDQRHALLQQLFRTGRFDQVERWLRDRRIELRRQSAVHQAVVADLVSRICEVVGEVSPDEWESSPTLLPDWSRDLQQQAAQRVSIAADGLATAQATHQAVSARRDALAHQHSLLVKGLEATARLRVLDEEAVPIQSMREQLAKARLAEGLQPVLRLMDDATAAAEGAEQARDLSLQQLRTTLPDAERESDLDDVRRHVVTALADVDRMAPVIARLSDWDEQLTSLSADATRAQQTITQLDARAAALPDEVANAREAVQTAVSASSHVALLQERHDQLVARLEARQLSISLRQEASQAEAAIHESREGLTTARERWLSIREQRLDGMAAEMATGLVAGDECPVCGSAEHPSPATGVAGAPDASAEKAARALVDDAEVVLEARREHGRAIETRLAVALAAAGDMDQTLEAQVADLARELQEARGRAQGLEAAHTALDTLEVESALLSEQRDTASRAHTSALTQLEAVQQQLSQARAELGALTARWDVDQPTHLQPRLAALEFALTKALDAETRAEATRGACSDAEQAAEEGCRSAGFDAIEDARQAVLTPAEAAAIEEQIKAHEHDRRRLQEVLADPEVASVLALPTAPDPTAAEVALAHADQALTDSRRRHDLATTALERLTTLGGELLTAQAAWSPVSSALDEVSALAAFVEGKSPDNRLQMRLSAYVLAHRLGQVVEAANLRLWRMSSQRYALIHTGERGRRETRGGLSLLVRDEWSGEARDPATLSGGESFVVSLALALGLADVITEEAGGADLHTLFVDEGFGALDAATLDDVMDTLDELRDAGRVVGVVSHVAELQTRIPTQLRVIKGRSGSSTRIQVS
jgi:exonuclease SbcC